MAFTLLSGCMDGRQGNYYQSYIDPLTAGNVIALEEGEQPKLIFSQNIEADKEKYQNLGFVIIGQSEFDTTDEKRYLRRNVDSHAQRAIEQAKKVHATHILYLREKVSENMETTIKDGKYETERFERFKNVSVYLVRGTN
ncbi:MAG: hypothetical protein R3D86_00690 [Emcibacteraceae bacterium]